jgi:hypothetical protein
MIYRCENPRRKDYRNYGGRSIRVCARWHKFENFFADMGPRPSSKHSIDRIDNDGDYEPGNCRWATRGEQRRNARHTVWITHGKKRLCLKDWARDFGVAYEALARRVRRGEDLESAVAAIRSYSGAS